MRMSSSVTTSGGSRRTTLSPAVTASSFSSRMAADQLGVRHAALDAEHQADAADVLDDVREIVGDGGQTLLHEQRLAR